MIQSRNNNHYSISQEAQIEKKDKNLLILTANQYRKLCNQQKKSQTSQFYQKVIYQSLLHYEKLIQLLKALLLKQISQANIFIKRAAFNKLKIFNDSFLLKDLDHQQEQAIKPFAITNYQCSQISKAIENKVLQQQIQQHQLLDCMKEQIYQEQIAQLNGILVFHTILNSKLHKTLSFSFRKIIQKFLLIDTKQKQQKRIMSISNFVIKTNQIYKKQARMFLQKLKFIKEQEKTMQICKQTENFFISTNFTLKNIAELAFDINQDKKLKQKVIHLMFLNLLNNVKDCFKKWKFINNIYKLSHCGCQQFSKSLVLKSLVSLLRDLQKRKKKFVIQKFKNNKNFILITKNLLKKQVNSKGRLIQACFKKIQDLPQKRQKQIFLRTYLKRWIFYNNFCKLKQESFNLKKQKYLNQLISLWKINRNKKIIQFLYKFKSNSQIVGIIKNYFKKVLISKAGLCIIALKKIQYLPSCACGCRNAHEKFRKKLILNKLINKITTQFVTRSMNSFLNELIQARKLKNLSLLKLVDNANKTKHLFNRWLKIVQQQNSVKKCQKMLNIFNMMNNLIVNKMNNLIEQNKPKMFNKRFIRSANKIALNSKINIDKSFWRLQQTTFQNIKEDKKEEKIIKISKK